MVIYSMLSRNTNFLLRNIDKHPSIFLVFFFFLFSARQSSRYQSGRELAAGPLHLVATAARA